MGEMGPSDVDATDKDDPGIGSGDPQTKGLEGVSSPRSVTVGTVDQLRDVSSPSGVREITAADVRPEDVDAMLTYLQHPRLGCGEGVDSATVRAFGTKLFKFVNDNAASIDRQRGEGASREAVRQVLRVMQSLDAPAEVQPVETAAVTPPSPPPLPLPPARSGPDIAGPDSWGDLSFVDNAGGSGVDATQAAARPAPAATVARDIPIQEIDQYLEDLRKPNFNCDKEVSRADVIEYGSRILGFLRDNAEIVDRKKGRGVAQQAIRRLEYSLSTLQRAEESPPPPAPVATQENKARELAGWVIGNTLKTAAAYVGAAWLAPHVPGISIYVWGAFGLGVLGFWGGRVLDAIQRSVEEKK